MRQVFVPIAFFALSCAALPGRADDQDVIDYRQHVMKTMGEQMGAIGMILQNKVPPDNFALHLKVLAITATQAKIGVRAQGPGRRCQARGVGGLGRISRSGSTNWWRPRPISRPLRQHDSVAQVGAKLQVHAQVQGLSRHLSGAEEVVPQRWARTLAPLTAAARLPQLPRRKLLTAAICASSRTAA